MSKVMDHRQVWYQEVASRDYYLENDLERTIMLYLELIFPEFIVFPFKQDLINTITGKKSAADLGMVKSDYTEWYVIEVELGKHSQSDVIEQIETFRNFKPTSDHVHYIDAKRPNKFNFTKLNSLVTTKTPELMVIVNEYKAEWKRELQRLNCKMCVFQIYSDFSGKRMYRINGEHPFVFTDFCNCKYEKQLPNTVKVLQSDFLNGYGIKDGDSVDIIFNGVKYRWERVDAGQQVFLICNSPVPPLDPLSSRYRLNFKEAYIKSKAKKILIKIVDWFSNGRTIARGSTFTFIKD
jgi:hypothetical protein